MGHERLGITCGRAGAGHPDRLPGYDFQHLSLLFLITSENIVERAYRTDVPEHERAFSEVERVSTADR